MIEAYAVADVRAAEEAAMAGLPEGELMARKSKDGNNKSTKPPKKRER